MSSRQEQRNFRRLGYEVFIIALSILAIGNGFFLLWPRPEPIVKGVVIIMNTFFNIIFGLDFLYRLLSSRSKTNYFLANFGWADLLSCIPIGYTNFFRVFRIYYSSRQMRKLGIKSLMRQTLKKADNALFATILFVILVLEFGSIAIVHIEANAPEANILSPEDAIWWNFVTITTVGYGDRYPVTSEGRAFGMLTMTIGVGLFGVLTGFLANTFIPSSDNDLTLDFASLISPESQDQEKNQINEIYQLLDEHERITKELRHRLTIIEQKSATTNISENT